MQKLLVIIFISVTGLGKLVAQTGHTDTTYYGFNRTTVVYDALNRKISEVGQTWLTPQNSPGTPFAHWRTDVKDYYTYSALNKIISHLTNGTDSYGGCISHLDIYTYTRQNVMTRDLHQTWNGNAWVNCNQHSWDYDSSGKYMDTALFQMWKGNSWVNSTRTTNTYNTKNAVTINLYQYWNSATWVNSSRTIFKYNENDVLISQLQQYWNGTAWLDRVIHRPQPIKGKAFTGTVKT